MYYTLSPIHPLFGRHPVDVQRDEGVLFGYIRYILAQTEMEHRLSPHSMIPARCRINPGDDFKIKAIDLTIGIYKMPFTSRTTTIDDRLCSLCISRSSFLIPSLNVFGKKHRGAHFKSD